MGIRLHKDYGVNPTISICILCGKEKNEIALLGAAYKGEAPMHMVTSVEPCEKCREKYLSQGVLMIEAEQTPKGFTQKEFTYKPNGNMAVITDKAFKKMFPKKGIPEGKICFVEPGLLKKIGVLDVK